MHATLKAQIEQMGYDSKNVVDDPQTEQDFLIMSKLLRITRTDDFSEEELEFYQWAAENAATEESSFCRGRILTPDFTPEELTEYQWAAEHPTGSCRGYRFTDEPTEQEVKEWQESLSYFNGLDMDEVRTRVKFIDREPAKPYADDPFADFFPGNAQTCETVASCNLGNDPYSLDPRGW